MRATFWYLVHSHSGCTRSRQSRRECASAQGETVSCAAKATTETSAAHQSSGVQKRLVSMPTDWVASHSPLCTKPLIATRVASSVAMGMTRTAQ
jgi:hypothetical protein